MRVVIPDELKIRYRSPARGLGVAVKSIGQNELGQPMTLELLPGSSLNGRPIP